MGSDLGEVSGPPNLPPHTNLQAGPSQQIGACPLGLQRLELQQRVLNRIPLALDCPNLFLIFLRSIKGSSWESLLVFQPLQELSTHQSTLSITRGSFDTRNQSLPLLVTPLRGPNIHPHLLLNLWCVPVQLGEICLCSLSGLNQCLLQVNVDCKFGPCK